MNILYFFLGLPVGVLLFPIGKALMKRYKGNSDTIRGLLLGLPIAVFALIVILVEMIV